MFFCGDSAMSREAYYRRTTTGVPGRATAKIRRRVELRTRIHPFEERAARLPRNGVLRG
jgi:hypothetical protein